VNNLIFSIIERVIAGEIDPFSGAYSVVSKQRESSHKIVFARKV